MSTHRKAIVRIGSYLGAGITAAALSLGSFAGTLPVCAAENIQMSTDYPGISVKPGDSVSFSLDFSNPSVDGEIIELSQTGLPSGWTGTFEGNGREISSVYAKGGENDSLASYNVTVPDDAAKGTYNVTLKGDGSTLKLSMNVTDENTGTSQLSTDYKEQQGTSGTTFKFNTTIQNSTSEKQSYSLNAKAPAGWNVSFQPSGASTATSSTEVDAHGSQAVDISVVSPADVKAGEYEIPVSAVSGDQTLETTLKVTITGSYDTVIATADGTLSFTANANHKKSVTLNVTNNGNLDLQGLNLTSTAPSDWEVEFSESTIDTLAAGETKAITMYVTPSKNAISGDYSMSVKASNEETSQTSAFRVTVKTGTAWGITGVCIIVVVIAALAAVFHKFGRH